jgi:hypothetical protein
MLEALRIHCDETRLAVPRHRLEAVLIAVTSIPLKHYCPKPRASNCFLTYFDLQYMNMKLDSESAGIGVLSAE